MKSAIFDLDGTLADTSRDLVAAANCMLESLGCDSRLEAAADRAIAFLGGRAMLREGLSRAGRPPDERLIDRCYPQFLEYYEEAIDRWTCFYPGAIETLDALAASGWKLGICTNKPERLARLLMERLGALGRFGSLVGADTLPVRKPAPEPLLHCIREAGGTPERAVFVGDTETDLQTARAANVPVILTAFGQGHDPAAGLAPDAVIAKFGDLPRAASELLAERE